MPDTYNGNWPNKATWLVFTRLTDEGGYIEQVMRKTAKLGAAPLRSMVEDYIEMNQLRSFTNPLGLDLFDYVLDTIDWEYLAQALREE